jgi:hypothetical protein
MESGKSWSRMNAALQDGLKIAIGYGFIFRRDDFVEIEKRFNCWHWMGSSDSGIGERYYAQAVDPGDYHGRKVPNLTAAKAFEHWKERKPYIVKGRRLAVGSSVVHPEHGWLWVTTIGAEELRMCWYDNPGNQMTGIPKRRFVFTHKTIKSEGLK